MARPYAGYKDAAGNKIPGVTTIIGRFKESGGLVHWAWKLGTEGKDYRKERDNAASIGTYVHDWVEATINKQAQPIVPVEFTLDDIAACERSYNQWRHWYFEHGFTIERTEIPLISNRGFAGTIDAYGVDKDGVVCLIDWKTGKAVYKDVMLQMGAYMILLEEHGFTVPREVHVVNFTKIGELNLYKWTATEMSTARSMFFAILAAYKLDKDLEPIFAKGQVDGKDVTS